MTDIYIIGASGLAKEIATYILDGKINSITAFVDKEIKNNHSILIRGKNYPVIDENDFFTTIDLMKVQPNVVIAIGYPKTRKQVSDKYISCCNFPNIIHPSVYCLSMPKIGMGNIVAPNVLLSVDIKIGNFNLINYGTTVGHDSIIGDYNVILPQNIISGNVMIGSQNLFGAGTSVIENITVGNENVIGMGSVSIHSMRDGDTFVGVPARSIK
ncbi:transferase [Spirochaetia bacterium]|nr:transferase [Spirochaetia bacterium]